MRNWKEAIRQVQPYLPGEQPDAPNSIKLNTNENPYPPAPGVREALRAQKADPLRLYPDPEAKALTRAIAQQVGVKPEQVFAGVGSDDVLATAFLTFFNSGRPILFPDVTYSFYPVWAECYRIPYRTVPLRETWEIDPADYVQENGGIVFPNPNAPTGLAMAKDGVRHILENNPESLVIVDEAYVDFGATSAVPLLAEFENLLVVQTFSKSRSLAGLRIGYAVGQEEAIRALSDVRSSINSYTLNRPAQEIGLAALHDTAYFAKTIQKICDTRDSVREELEQMGFTCLESKANFLFVTHPEHAAIDVLEQLRARGIYVRHFAQPRIESYLRITIGTRGQMQVLLDALRQILRGEGEKR